MKYTGKAIGLLSAQYRSILKKCFLINCGIFALMEANSAVAAFSPTLGEKSAYEVSVGSATDYNFLVTDGTEKSYWKINFNTDNLEGEHTNVSDSSTETTGSVSVILPNNASQTTLYYTYTKPSLYQQTSTRLTSITTDNVTNKLFQNAYISGAKGSAIYNVADKSSVSIISDFVGNHNRSAYGGAIYNSGKIGSITGDFIKNYTESSSSEARGGVISNFGTITEIIGDFIGNGSQSTNSYSDAGAIYNRDANAKIESIKGNFIGNYSIGRTAASGGIMWNNGSIGSIAGNFVGNYAKSSGYGNYEARGGVFSANNGTIGSITGDFIGNYVDAYQSIAEGGAIFKENGNITEAITGDFIGNYAVGQSAMGGAVYVRYNLSGEISGSFIGNHADGSSTAHGGAVWTGGNMNFKADNITSVFSGNYVTKNSGITKQAEAIYVNSSIVTLTFKAVNNGKFVFDDYINGFSGYDVKFTGDSTGTIGLFNDIKNADVITDSVTMNLADGKVHDYTFRTLTSNADTKWIIDVDLANVSAPTSDKIITTSKSSGTVTLSGLNFINGQIQDIIDKDIKIQILSTQSGLKLAIDEALSDQTTPKIISQTENTVVNNLGENTNWSDVITADTTITTVEGILSTVKTSTDDDSIGVKVVSVTSQPVTSNYDALKAVNQSDLATRNFNATGDGEIFTVTDDLGATEAGVININGKTDYADANGTIDFNGKTGFELDKATTLSITDTNIINVKSGTKVIDAKSSGAIINLTGSIISGSILNAGELNIDNSKISGNITGSGENQGTINVKTAWEMTGIALNQNINVKSGAKLTIGAGSLISSDNLNAENGSEIDIAGNKIDVGEATFATGSTLSLKVNSLGDFGGLTANKITVADTGAKLSVTLAQGIQNGTLQLLKADNTDFNNFEDIYDNSMYIFEKDGKNGLYNIKLAKTAEEISREAGGTETEARAARAWVDGNEFPTGTKEKEIADALAGLAQHDPQAFNEELSVIAPSEMPIVQMISTEVGDKLMLAVRNHLSGNDSGGLSSGDALQDATIWAKGYYGESKLSDYGNNKGFETKNKGVIVGTDKKLSRAGKIGFGFQYNYSDIDGFRRAIETDTLAGFVYGEYRPGKWFVNGVLSFSETKFKNQKLVFGEKFRYRYNADTYSLQGIIGHDFKYITPEIGARYYHIKRHGYDDNLGQKISGNDLDLLRGVAGLRISHDFGTFKPEFYAGLTYDIVSDKDTAVVSLPNGSCYTVDGKSLDSFGTEFSGNIRSYLSDNFSITLGYDGKFSSHYRDHTGLIGAKYEF